MEAQNEINHLPEMTFEQFFDQYYKRLSPTDQRLFECVMLNVEKSKI